MNADSHFYGQGFALLLHPIAELGDLLMDGKGGANGFLGGVFEGHRCTKKCHDAITGHFINHALVIMNLVDQDFIDFVHDRVGLFDTKGFQQRREILHIGEQYRDLLALSFNAAFLGKDFLPQAFGQVFLDVF